MTKPKSSSNSGNGYSTVLDSLQKVIHSRQRLLESISRAGGTGVAFAAGGGIAVEQIDSLRELEEKAMAEYGRLKDALETNGSTARTCAVTRSAADNFTSSDNPLSTTVSYAARRVNVGGDTKVEVQKMESAARDMAAVSDAYSLSAKYSEESRRRKNHETDVALTENDLNRPLSFRERKMRKLILDKVWQKNKNLSQIFRSFDKNGDGLISEQEFRDGLRVLSVNMPPRDVDMLIRRSIRNEEGIDYVEFSNALQQEDNGVDYSAKSITRDRSDSVSGNGSTSGKKLTDFEKKLHIRIMDKIYQKNINLRLVFRQFDEDKDGRVSWQEFRKGMENLGVGLTDGELTRVLQCVDADRSGDIDYNEFACALKWIDCEQTLDDDTLTPARLNNRDITTYKEPQPLASPWIQKTSPKLEMSSSLRWDQGTHSKSSLPNHIQKNVCDRIFSRMNQRNKPLRQYFRELDLYKDGIVSEESFRNGLNELGIRLTDSEFHNLVDFVPKNDQGQINYLEFESFLKSSENATQHLPMPRAPHVIPPDDPDLDPEVKEIRAILRNKVYQKKKDLRSVFRAFDEDKNGTISYDEFRLGLECLGIRLKEHQMQKLLANCDIDGNKEIDYSEFAQSLKWPDTDQYSADKWHVFQSGDVSLTGNVRNEVPTALSADINNHSSAGMTIPERKVRNQLLINCRNPLSSLKTSLEVHRNEKSGVSCSGLRLALESVGVQLDELDLQRLLKSFDPSGTDSIPIDKVINTLRIGADDVESHRSVVAASVTRRSSRRSIWDEQQREKAQLIQENREKRLFGTSSPDTSISDDLARKIRFMSNSNSNEDDSGRLKSFAPPPQLKAYKIITPKIQPPLSPAAALVMKSRSFKK